MVLEASSNAMPRGSLRFAMWPMIRRFLGSKTSTDCAPACEIRMFPEAKTDWSNTGAPASGTEPIARKRALPVPCPAALTAERHTSPSKVLGKRMLSGLMLLTSELLLSLASGTEATDRNSYPKPVEEQFCNLRRCRECHQKKCSSSKMRRMPEPDWRN